MPHALSAREGLHASPLSPSSTLLTNGYGDKTYDTMTGVFDASGRFARFQIVDHSPNAVAFSPIDNFQRLEPIKCWIGDR